MGTNVYPYIQTKVATPGTVTGILYQDDKLYSLYRFLDEHADDYPDASPSYLRNMNSYGI